MWLSDTATPWLSSCPCCNNRNWRLEKKDILDQVVISIPSLKLTASLPLKNRPSPRGKLVVSFREGSLEDSSWSFHRLDMIQAVYFFFGAKVTESAPRVGYHQQSLRKNFVLRRLQQRNMKHGTCCLSPVIVDNNFSWIPLKRSCGLKP